MQNSTLRMNAWKWSIGQEESDASLYLDTKLPTYDDFVKSEWSTKFELLLLIHCIDHIETEFEQLLRNRLMLGAVRYGKLNAKNKPQWDRIGSCMKRLSFYENNHNLENLIDIANLCMVEFEEGLDKVFHKPEYIDIHMSSIENIKANLKLYQLTKNTMYLMYAFTYCMHEFYHPEFDDAEIVLIDDGHHCKIQ